MCPNEYADTKCFVQHQQKRSVVMTVHTITHRLSAASFRGAREAQALSEELSLDSPCSEAVIEDPLWSWLLCVAEKEVHQKYCTTRRVHGRQIM